MAERSFAKEVTRLRTGEGEVFAGEGILAVTKALLQSGVSYVGGYQGAPISHLMDVLNDAKEILDELGVHFEACGSEATAGAMLSASINYPMRGAVTWKSTVGTNVASDAIANLASSGVRGGAMIILGEDYGEGASIMQERTHSFAMKSQMWLLDPRPNLPSIVSLVEQGFELSEASNTPVMLMMRVRACHVTGEFVAKDNVAPEFGKNNPVAPHREADKIILPPNVFEHEQAKVADRLPRAIEFIKENKLNEHFEGSISSLGIILQGGMYNTTIRALQQLGLADPYGQTPIPLYVLNVTYPLIGDEVLAFCTHKERVLVVEEGQPNHLEQAIQTIISQQDRSTRIAGKGYLPIAGEYTGQAVLDGVATFLIEANLPELSNYNVKATYDAMGHSLPVDVQQTLADNVPARPSGLCTGCPERPLFSAIKQLQQEAFGELHISSDIGCHSFATLPPFNLGNTIMGYGLSLASSSALHNALPHRSISIMGDGGFWHNGLNSGVVSSVFNHHDSVLIVVNNGYSAATGGQDIPSMVHPNLIASTMDASHLERQDSQSIEDAVKGVGVEWVRTMSTYDISGMKEVLREAMTTDAGGLKVIVAEGECMLNRQRRIKPLMKKAQADGERVVRARFYVDPEICTGDRACIRLSGCPSLNVRPNPDPLREDPVTYVDNTCVGCGVCGGNAHSAVLCPSFARADVISNPGRWDKFKQAARQSIIGRMQNRLERSDARRSL